MRAARVFELLSWLPPAALLWTHWSLSRMEGWGAWAAAPAFVPVIGLSALMAVAGAVLWIRARRRGERVTGLLLATLLAATPLMWFLWRMVKVELARGG